MKTDALIDMLACNAGRAPRALAARRLAPAACVGALASAVLASALFGIVPAALFSTPVPWLKLAYTGALAAATGWLAARLARPGASDHSPRRAIAAAGATMAVIGAASLLATPGDPLAQVLGYSWTTCPLSVLMLSLPALAASLWALAGLAPTRPAYAGFAAGLLAGSVGALGYSLSCPEPSPAFVAVWYTLGIVLTGALGAAIGPRLLRW
jgi:hypothetical protein